MSPRIRLAALAIPVAVVLAACSSSPKSALVTHVPTAKAVAPAASTAQPASTVAVSPVAASPARSSAAPAAALSGTWSGHYSGSYQGSFTLTWTQSGSRLTGTIKLSTPPSTMSINGAVRGDSISFGTVGSYGITYSGRFSGASMSGSYQVSDGRGSSGPWNASRAS